MKSALHTLSERLKWLRRQTGRSARQIALSTGFGVSYLSRLESGNRDNPSPDILEKLADYYGANLRWIATGEGEKYKDDEVGAAKNELFSCLDRFDKIEGGSREDIVLANIRARVAQFRFCDESQRVRYIKEIVAELTAFSGECEKHYPEIKSALLKTAKAIRKKGEH